MIGASHPVAIMKTPELTEVQEEQLVTQLQCPVINQKSPNLLKEPPFIFFVNKEGALQLQKTGKTDIGPLFIDFISGSTAWRRKHGGGKKQAIAKAVGLGRQKHPINVLDCTAGLGVDSFILAALGCNVTMLERSAFLALLLEDGIKRAKLDAATAKIINQMSLHMTSAHLFLKEQAASKKSMFDVIYLDPMFPQKSKNAAVKKEMQYLQELLHSDKDDADELLTLALACACQRVVVKRPRLAERLGESIPTYSLIGKSTRFDIYIT